MRKFWRRLRGFPSPLPLLFIVVGTIVVILYGRGYRPDLTDNSIKSTGLLSATSDPVGAQVYVDGQLKTATNNPINVGPGWYTVRITKEGYIPWEKRLRVQGEVVTRADAFLFPANPSLSPITNTGIENPLLSPDGTKIAYTIPASSVESRRSGLWVYDMVDRPLGLNRDPRQLGISEVNFNFATSTLTWSPDSTQLMVNTGTQVRLYNANRTGDYQDVSASYTFILKEWNGIKTQRLNQQLATFKQGVIDIATSSAKIISLSPDETKILYEATASATIPLIIDPPQIGTNPIEEQRTIEPGKLYVYDSKEDKNYFVFDTKEIAQTASPSPTPRGTTRPTTSPIPQTALLPVSWFPTNRHLVLTLPGKIDIIEYDRTNWVTVYSGPFEKGFMATWPNTSRIIVLINLNPGVSTLPNLYTVNLR